MSTGSGLDGSRALPLASSRFPPRHLSRALAERMTELDDALARLMAHEGVDHIFLVGHDGLLVRRHGEGAGLDADRLAAMTPELATACSALGTAAQRGAFRTAVLEFDAGVALVAALSPEVLIGVLLRSGVGFAPLLRSLRRERDELARLI